MFRRFRDMLANTSYLPVACALVFPTLAWVLGFYMGDYWWSLTVLAVGAAGLWFFARVIFWQGRVRYQVTLSKLDENAVPQEQIKKHATFIHTRELRRLMQSKGGMSRKQWIIFSRKLHKEQWAHHFPPPVRGNTYMFVITYHKENN